MQNNYISKRKKGQHLRFSERWKDDSELIFAANKIGLISDIGYKNLDHIRYMRNWASAANPNQVEIDAFNLLSWLSNCIEEVINPSVNKITTNVKELLKNIRNNELTKEDIHNFSLFINNMTLEKLNYLAEGLFGIYTRKDTLPMPRQNIKALLPIV